MDEATRMWLTATSEHNAHQQHHAPPLWLILPRGLIRCDSSRSLHWCGPQTFLMGACMSTATSLIPALVLSFRLLPVLQIQLDSLPDVWSSSASAGSYVNSSHLYISARGNRRRALALHLSDQTLTENHLLRDITQDAWIKENLHFLRLFKVTVPLGRCATLPH